MAHPHSKKTSGTVAERVAWFSRTSDIHGSHLKTDLDSYLALIRRKIQEKCSTTVELITQIRRNKIGDSGHVTPNEFRFTLIKFGVILPQPLVDRIFNVFDSDRSGTMDFDEFAMWIMNSEFRPVLKTAPHSIDTPRTVLRYKLKEAVDANRKSFITLPKEVSYLQFVSDVSRLSCPWTERETRAIFQTLDPKDTGFVESKAILTWADTGVIITEPEKLKPIERKFNSLGDLINKVVGRNSRQLESAFQHIKLGEGIKISFDEFRRCLLNAGVGKNLHDCNQVFMALGGKEHGLADIDLFFKTLSPIMIDPASEVSMKPQPTPEMNATRADRVLRERMRKSYKIVAHDIEHSDPTHCGYIDAEKLFKILVKRCMPLTFQDFRFIVQQIQKEPGSTRLDYHHFLHGYDPQHAPHQLEGPLSIKTYSPTKISNDQFNKNKDLTRISSSSAFLKSAGTNPRIEEEYNQNVLAAKERYLASHPNTATLKTSFANTNTGNSTTASTAAAMTESKSSSDLRIPISNGFTSNFHGGTSAELKRIWQSVLRECHRSDPERVGQVSRVIFINALEKSDANKEISPEAMSKLADQFTLSNGLVNYLHLFRTYLNDLTTPSSLLKSQSMSLFNAKHNTNTTSSPSKSPTKSGELKPIHPWDYDYKREKHGDPYWIQANTMPRDLSINLSQSSKLGVVVPPPNEKGAGDLTSTEKDLLLSQYKKQVLDLCAKCYLLLAPIWRPLRNHFKKEQIPSQRGSVLTANFLSILESHGIMLSKIELATLIRAFRGLGMQDVVKYDEFLRVCMLMKDNIIPATD